MVLISPVSYACNWFRVWEFGIAHTYSDPIIRIANPGPGNGCLHTISVGNPKLAPPVTKEPPLIDEEAQRRMKTNKLGLDQVNVGGVKPGNADKPHEKDIERH